VAFPLALASVLTGASTSQLTRWRRTGLLVPEVQAYKPPLYSFRDLAALRTAVYLRGETSLQRVRKAFAKLPEMDLTAHPSEYTFATDGRTIVVWTEDGFVDLVRNPGQMTFATLEDIFKPFPVGDQLVPDFRRPRPRLRVDGGRIGGWPTIENSRLPYDNVARLVAAGDVSYEDVRFIYPGVDADAVADAVDFDNDVQARLKRA
jgi:uncharacterized protein (DUF433 family)/DNA-binding transcriptional MerR regulator